MRRMRDAFPFFRLCCARKTKDQDWCGRCVGESCTWGVLRELPRSFAAALAPSLGCVTLLVAVS